MYLKIDSRPGCLVIKGDLDRTPYDQSPDLDDSEFNIAVWIATQCTRDIVDEYSKKPILSRTIRFIENRRDSINIVMILKNSVQFTNLSVKDLVRLGISESNSKHVVSICRRKVIK